MVKKVLFVCTGNVFRSLSAERLLKKYLRDKKIRGWKIDSAGTQKYSEPVCDTVVQTLKELGVSCSSYKQKKVTKKLLAEQDVIIAMAQDHLAILREEYGMKNVLLFDELAIKKESSVLDIEYVFEHPSLDDKEVQQFIKHTVRFINKKVSTVFSEIQTRFFLFEDFVNKKVTHRNGYPFIKLYETKLALAFMSLDIPVDKNAHFLVIPKKRYQNFLDIPSRTLQDMMACVKIIGSAIEQEHDGFNILLNNSLAAGQYIFHAHIHVVPRDFEDGIVIESWKKQDVNVKEFKKLNAYWKKKIRTIKK